MHGWFVGAFLCLCWAVKDWTLQFSMEIGNGGKVRALWKLLMNWYCKLFIDYTFVRQLHSNSNSINHEKRISTDEEEQAVRVLFMNFRINGSQIAELVGAAQSLLLLWLCHFGKYSLSAANGQTHMNRVFLVLDSVGALMRYTICGEETSGGQTSRMCAKLWNGTESLLVNCWTFPDFLSFCQCIVPSPFIHIKSTLHIPYRVESLVATIRDWVRQFGRTRKPTIKYRVFSWHYTIQNSIRQLRIGLTSQQQWRKWKRRNQPVHQHR